RVHAKTDTTVDLKVTAAEYAAAVPDSIITFKSGFVVLRTSEVQQRIKVTAGTYNINTFADLLNAQLICCKFRVQEDLRFILTTNTLQEGVGSVMFVTTEEEVSSIGFTDGDSDITKVNHTASYESGGSLGDYPAFAHSAFATEGSASPNDSFINSL